MEADEVHNALLAQSCELVAPTLLYVFDHVEHGDYEKSLLPPDLDPAETT